MARQHARKLAQPAAHVENAFDSLKVDSLKTPGIDEFVQRCQAALLLGRSSVDVKGRLVHGGHLGPTPCAGILVVTRPSYLTPFGHRRLPEKMFCSPRAARIELR